MQQTTRVKDGNPTGTTADAGPYTYAPPVVSGAPPPTTPQPAQSKTGWSFGGVLGLILLNVVAQMFADLAPFTKLQSYTLIWAVTMIVGYWATTKPRQGFWRWTAKIVGLFLNFHVGFVTVPESLRGLLPAPLAFALPAFVFLLLLFNWAPSLFPNDNKRTTPLWQLLLWAAGLAAFWGWVGPGAVE